MRRGVLAGLPGGDGREGRAGRKRCPDDTEDDQQARERIGKCARSTRAAACLVHPTVPDQLAWHAPIEFGLTVRRRIDDPLRFQELVAHTAGKDQVVEGDLIRQHAMGAALTFTVCCVLTTES